MKSLTQSRSCVGWSIFLCGCLLAATGPLSAETPVKILGNPAMETVHLWWLPGDPSNVLEASSNMAPGTWAEVDQNHANGHEASTAGAPMKFFRLRSGGSAQFLQITGVNPPAGKVGTAVEITGRVSGGRRPYVEGSVALFGLNIEPLVFAGRFRARVMIPVDLPPGEHPFDVTMADSSAITQFALHSGDFTAQAVAPLTVTSITGPTSVSGGSTTMHTLTVAGGIGPMSVDVPVFIGSKVITRRVPINGASINFPVTWGTGINSTSEVPITVTDTVWSTAVGAMFYELTNNPSAPSLDAWGYPVGYPFGQNGNAGHPDGYDGYPSDHPNNPTPGVPGKGGDGWNNPDPNGTGGKGGAGGAAAAGDGNGGLGGTGGSSFGGTAGDGGAGGSSVEGTGGGGGNGGHSTNGIGGDGGRGGDSTTGQGGFGGNAGGSATGVGGEGGQGGASRDNNGGVGGQGGSGAQPGNGGDGGASTNGGGGSGGIGGNSNGGAQGGTGGEGGASKNGVGGVGGTGGTSFGGIGGTGGRGGDAVSGTGGVGGTGGTSMRGLGGNGGDGGDSPQGHGGPGGNGGPPVGTPGSGGAGANGQNGARGGNGPP